MANTKFKTLTDVQKFIFFSSFDNKKAKVGVDSSSDALIEAKVDPDSSSGGSSSICI